MAMVQAFIHPLMVAKGVVINVSSLSARVPFPFRSVYSASKSALDGYSRSLRLELMPLGVRVMVVMAGVVKSNLAKPKERLPETSLYRPAEDIYADNNAERGILAGDFAEQVATAATKEPGWFSKGTPDWFWAGEFAKVLRFLGFFGEGAVNALVWRLMRLGEISNRLGIVNA
jgi:1-acylglycerone phosphate reductase